MRVVLPAPVGPTRATRLSRPRLERDVLERVDAALIAEVDPFERDLPAGSLDVDRVRRVLDLDLGVPQRQGAARVDELLLQRADRGGHLLQRLVR